MNKVIGNSGKWGGESARAHNRCNVMKNILANPGIDRTRLAELTNLTNAAMTKIVQELITADLLKDVGQLQTSSGRGRRRSGLMINEAGGYVLGISILAFNSSIALTNIAGETVDEFPIDLKDISKVQQTLDEVAEIALKLLDKHSIDRTRVFGAGIAVAGHLTADGSVLESSPFLGWPAFNIQQSLVERLGFHVVVENVNRCIAIAESNIGCSKGTQEMVLIRAALGIGGAIISSGEILRGHNNQAGQLGHVPVDPNGLSCTCGAKGCLNTLASGRAILNQLKLDSDSKADLNLLKSLADKLRKVLEQASAGEKSYQDVVRQAGESLALNSLTILHSLAPQAVVLTGPLGRNKTYSDAFQRILTERGQQIKVLTAKEHQITSPAPAASGLSLTSHFYSPYLDIQYLLTDDQDLGQSEKEALVL